MRDRELMIKFRVGIFVLALLVLFVVFVLTIGVQTRLFEEQYVLRAAFGDVQGLIVGAPVRLAGLRAGVVRQITFGPDVADPRIHVEVAVNGEFQSRIRQDSVASIGTIGLVGDKVFDITVGSESAAVLQPGQVLQSAEPVDYARLVSRGGEVLEGLGDLSRTLKAILVDMKEGRGLLHTLIADEAGAELIRDLAVVARSIRTLSERAEKGEGILGALMSKEGGADLVAEVKQTLAEVQAVVRRLQAGEGLLGALLTDPDGARAVHDLRAAAADLKRITAALADGQGTLGALIRDPTVYEDLSSLLRGAERSWILRGLIRSGVRRGGDSVKEGQQ